jgi:cobalt-zinc-cadmium efflux system membrane fusion protein
LKRRLRKFEIAAIGIVLLLIALFVLRFYFNGAQASSSEPAEAKPATAASVGSDLVRLPANATTLGMIRSQVLAATPLPVADALSARVAYDEDTTVRVTAGFNGRIARLIASPGDIVKVGSPLATIDSPDFGLALSDLVKARADEEHKRRTLERSRDLLSGGVIPLKDVESAQADFDQAVAETARASQRVKNLNPGGSAPNGESFTLASPMAGIVTERNANPAMEVNPSLVQPLFVISDLHRLWVLIDLPERLLGKVATGTHVAIESDAYPGTTFDGTIVHIAQILDPGTRRIAVRALVDNASLELRPEMFVRATILGTQGTGVRVPNEALITEGLYSYVFVQVDDHSFRRVRVETSIKGNSDSYVDRGLAGGERVVTAGALLLAAEQSTSADH